MSRVIIEVNSSKLEQLMVVLSAIKDDIISNYKIEQTSSDEKIDVEGCLKTLSKIESKDYSDIKKVAPDGLFKELGI